MATKTVTIYGSASAYTDSRTPNTANTNKTTIAVGDVSFSGPGHIQGYEKFVAPESIRGKKAVSAVLHVYARRKQTSFVETTAGYDVYAISSDWNPAQATDSNPPQTNGGVDTAVRGYGSSFAWREIPINDFKVAANMTSFGVRFHNFFEYYTSNSNYKPYIVVTVEDGGGLRPSPKLPTGGFVDNRNGCTVEWNLTVLAGTIEPVTQIKAVVSWSYSGAAKTATVTGTSQRYAIPASQLPEQGNVSWTVSATDNGGNTNAASTSASFYTTDATCTAWPTSPINAYVDGSQTVTFSWQRSISTGSPANGADFQVSTDGGITWASLGHTTGYSDFQAAPNTLPAGNVLWRVRGYNTDGVAGPWSSPANIVVRRAPNTPVIAGITAVPRPTVTWQAEGQQAYQLQVGSWDSGPVYGTAKSAQVPVFLPPGAAAVRLRVQNSFGLWSQWATTSITIQNRPGEAITLQAANVRGGIRLSWSTQGSYIQYIVYRDGEAVGTAQGARYTDYGSIGKSRYTVRGIRADSTYTDSSRAVAILTIPSGMLAEVGVWDWLTLNKRMGSRPARSHSENEEMTLTWYSGRAMPVAELSGKRQHTASYAYSLPSWGDVARIRAMEGKQVVYKHRDGEMITGILGGLSWSCVRRWWDVSFTITEVDHGTVF